MTTTTTATETELETLRARLAALEASAPKPAAPLSAEEIHRQRVAELQIVHEAWYGPPRIVDPFVGIPNQLLAPHIIRAWPVPSIEHRGNAIVYCGPLLAFTCEPGTRAKDTARFC